LEGPIKKSPNETTIYPKQITADFLNLEVRMKIRGLVAA
jgi:hypothetical protein